jgi:hypothetical protein
MHQSKIEIKFIYVASLLNDCCRFETITYNIHKNAKTAVEMEIGNRIIMEIGNWVKVNDFVDSWEKLQENFNFKYPVTSSSCLGSGDQSKRAGNSYRVFGNYH